MHRIRAIIWKEFIQLLRDPKTLGLVIFMPVMQLLLYGYGINTDVKHLSTIVYNEDHSPLSRRLIEALQQSEYFDFNDIAGSNREIRTALDRGRAKAGLHIPPDFARKTLAGSGGRLQMIIDGTDSNPATTALNTSQAVVAAFLQKEGLVASPAQVIDFRPRLWYNPDLKSSYFLVPGVVGLLLMLLIPMITSSAVVREKERGNLEQLLVTPIRPYELILGKLIPYLLIGMFIATTVLSAAHFLFGVPVRGSALLLFGLTGLYMMVCLGLGLFASTLAENQMQASQMIMFFAAPSILLSGFFFPRETMPTVVHWLGNIIPLTFFLRIIRGITLKGLALSDLWLEVGVLAFMAVVVLTLSVLKFHKRLS
ncbi:MAG TPA: ABC transporter permease [Deltaproteobacteria bacterium]|nr:ABC transporter permease [Deltaproteobacteria bacterium]